MKKQNIPVSLRPKNFAFKQPTLLLIDNKAYGFNTPLNFLDDRGNLTAYRLHPVDNNAFRNSFALAINSPIQATPQPYPKVGTPKKRKKAVPRPSIARKPAYSGDKDGSYNYDKSKSSHGPAPVGVARKLPKVPKYKKQRKPAAKEPLLQPQKNYKLDAKPNRDDKIQRSPKKLKTPVEDH